MKRKRLRYAKWGYIFCAPFVLGFLIFSLYPIIFTGVIGFTDFKGMGAVDFNFLEDPFQNFKTVLTNPSFKKAFGNTIPCKIREDRNCRPPHDGVRYRMLYF